jgi:4a-hydroxytetrahydrobiopterin dehydratase
MSGSSLADRHCVPCEGGEPALEAVQVEPLLAQIEGWSLEQSAGHQELVKTFRFPNFLRAVGFVNDLTPVAEAEGHHPDLEVSWGRVRVRLCTHTARGLTENDFVLAAKIDRLQQSPSPTS